MLMTRPKNGKSTPRANGSCQRCLEVHVVPDVVRVTPRFLVDRRVPAELLRRERLRTRKAIVRSVQGGVTDLGGLQLLVNPEREDADREGNRLEAEVNEAPTEDLHRAREAIQPLDVPDVFGSDALLGALLDGVELLAESAEALVVERRRGSGQGVQSRGGEHSSSS